MSYRGYTIYANHAHVFPKAVWEEGSIDTLKRTMEQCYIEKCVTFAPFPSFLNATEYESNSWLHSEIKDDPSLTGFGIVDFSKGDLAGQVDRIAEFGFKGIKMHPAFQKFKVDGENAFQVYERAEKNGLFISFHTGVHWHRISDYNMLLFDEVAYHFKKLRFSMEHLGGYCFFKEGVAVMINNTVKDEPHRVYAGLTSVFDKNDNRFWHLNDGQIRDLLWLTGEERAIFGLDFPYNDAGKIFYAINHVVDLDIPRSAKEGILGGNLAAVLGL